MGNVLWRAGSDLAIPAQQMRSGNVYLAGILLNH